MLMKCPVCNIELEFSEESSDPYYEHHGFEVYYHKYFINCPFSTFEWSETEWVHVIKACEMMKKIGN